MPHTPGPVSDTGSCTSGSVTHCDVQQHALDGLLCCAADCAGGTKQQLTTRLCWLLHKRKRDMLQSHVTIA
jgi:hypothetical protein